MNHPAKVPPRGFTLVEMLVVIGIVVTLIAIFAFGVRHTRGLANRQLTESRFKLCEDLLAEYKAVNGYKNILGPAESVVTGMPIRLPSAWIAGQYNSPIFIYPKNNGSTEVTAQVDNPVSVLKFVNFKGSPGKVDSKSAEVHGSMSECGNPNDPRWVSDAVRWTQGVMFLLLKDPKNRALVSNLPPEGLLEGMCAPINITTGAIIGKKPSPFAIDAAVVLDGWQNPIIFVPPGGLHVWMNPGQRGLSEWIVRTSGTYQVDNPPPVGPNDHPFFASTGPDGYFTDTSEGNDDFGSDNLYSFPDH